ncbi:hypothetical protein T484DRAFT_3632196 [Baffinella frigidus]|nr:hypothetical protein T484DRAFT_3632196 [Cryptophyta sp. CCMP2293]
MPTSTQSNEANPPLLNSIDAVTKPVAGPAAKSAAKILLAAPNWVNYGRVFVDVVMAMILIFVVTADIGRSKSLPGAPIHVHEMPVCLKHDMDFSFMWQEAHKDTALSTGAAKVGKFNALVAVECASIETHPMCVCIAANTANDTIVAKNCLLQNPTPSVISDWNIGAVSSAMIIWFLASLATSVGTLPIINSYVSLVSAEDPSATGVVIKWNRYVIGMYLFTTLSAIIIPVIVTAVQFPGSAKHMQSLWGMLMWSGFALGILGSYNCHTIIRYLGYGVVPSTSVHEHERNDTTLLHMSLNNWILYMHLLVSAPAIAMVLHLTQQWTEFHTILNTTLVLSTIFAVDAFVVEMANFWVHRITKTSLHTSDDARTDEKTRETQDLHSRLGLIRLFSWVINAVMLLLLFTLAYPLEIEQNNSTSSAIFVVVVIAFAAVFLAPDLVREFTDQVAFNSIQFRLYGDFMMRALVLFFVWRASVLERT